MSLPVTNTVGLIDGNDSDLGPVFACKDLHPLRQQNGLRRRKYDVILDILDT